MVVWTADYGLVYQYNKRLVLYIEANKQTTYAVLLSLTYRVAQYCNKIFPNYHNFVPRNAMEIMESLECEWNDILSLHNLCSLSIYHFH